MRSYYSTPTSCLSWKYMCTLYIHVHTVQLYFVSTTIPDLSQSRAQKNFFSLKGFSEVGTGVIRGSSQVCASQYAIRSAAAFDTCRGRSAHLRHKVWKVLSSYKQWHLLVLHPCD
ncbi:hypothetical protein AMECASPLE_009993 [Ameca splendens]|uniref:Uncharacterized protein n=1 Tax=Ameca splendens TaxID=208324 RepID=A0ABV0Y0G3_9TELE